MVGSIGVLHVNGGLNDGGDPWQLLAGREDECVVRQAPEVRGILRK